MSSDSEQRRGAGVAERENDLLAWVGAGVAFALMMQVAPFRWAVYALVAWLGFLAFQDWWSEHELPASSPIAEWTIKEQALQSNADDQQLRYSVKGWFQNHGREALESAALVGRLYECDTPDQPIGRCTPVSESHDNLSLDLKPGFRTHFTVYPQFSGAGGPHPRVVWKMRNIIADNDWKLDQ